MKRLGFLIFWVTAAGGGANYFNSSARADLSREQSIDQVEILGAAQIESIEIEKRVEIIPGETFSNEKLSRTLRAIREFYRSKGFDGATVNARIYERTLEKIGAKESILEINITEGEPTRYGSGIEVDWGVQKGVRRKKAILDELKTEVGERFDRGVLERKIRAAVEILRSSNYLLAQFKVDVEPAAAPAGATVSAPRWVRVKLTAELGDQVTFGFRGNLFFSGTELQALITDQRALGFTQDYVTQIKNRISEEYIKNGYSRVQVTPYLFQRSEQEAQHVTFGIVEGELTFFDELVFEGNVIFSQVDLQKNFYASSHPLIQKNIFIYKEIQNSAAVVAEWMQSNGYLEARILSITAQPTGKRGHLRVVIYLNEGEETVLKDLHLTGIQLFSPAQILGWLQNDRQKPLNLFKLNDGVERLKFEYRLRGYLDAKILNEGQPSLIHYENENREAIIELQVDEGIQYTISHIEIVGLHKTKADVIYREMGLSGGEIANGSRIQDAEANLRRMGIFSRVNITIEQAPERKNGKNLRVEIQEGSPGLLAGGVGVRNDLGARVFGQVGYANLGGENRTLALTGAANRRYGALGGSYCASTQQLAQDPHRDYCFIEYNLQLGYVYPWFLGRRLTFRPRISVDKTQYRKFDASTLALALSLEKRLSSRLLSVSTYSLENINQFNANTDIDNQHIRIGTVSQNFSLDFRDNSLVPTRGFFTNLTFELAHPAFGSQNQPFPVAYTRVQVRQDFHHTLAKDYQLYLSFRSGLENNLSHPRAGEASDPRYSIPLIKQFALGGVGSLRGFREQGFVISETQPVETYASYVNYRAQLDLPFAGQVKFGPFIDAANLLVGQYTLTRHLRAGVGGGFHYLSPIGSVNFDLGINPDPKPGEDAYRIHFSIGTL